MNVLNWGWELVDSQLTPVMSDMNQGWQVFAKRWGQGRVWIVWYMDAQTAARFDWWRGPDLSAG